MEGLSKLEDNFLYVKKEMNDRINFLVNDYFCKENDIAVQSCRFFTLFLKNRINEWC